jgi:hypothetical protein
MSRSATSLYGRNRPFRVRQHIAWAPVCLHGSGKPIHFLRPETNMTKSARAPWLGATMLILASLVATGPADAQRIEWVQGHASEREACSHAGGRYEEGPGYFACIQERRVPEAPCAERGPGAKGCAAGAPSRIPGFIQRAWSGLRGFRFGR